jgi:hypothetical protein
MMLQSIRKDWHGPCVVAASGPSLKTIPRNDEWRYIAVNDAWRLFPFADILYAADLNWWDVYEGVPGFHGEKWTTHDDGTNDKSSCVWPLNIVRGDHKPGFSTDQNVLHYGSNSGFQAVNLAILKGATKIVLIGFDLRVNGKRHFFGDHPEGLRNTDNYHAFAQAFRVAARDCPVPIFNATHGSALDCFPMVDIEDVM